MVAVLNNKPCDALLLNKIGKGSIHFCGNGQHLVESMLEIPDLLGLDFGNPDYMDMQLLYSMCSKQKVSITNVSPTREALVGGAACKAMPTGVVFLYYTDNFEDAGEVACKYRNFRK